MGVLNVVCQLHGLYLFIYGLSGCDLCVHRLYPSYKLVVKNINPKYSASSLHLCTQMLLQHKPSLFTFCSAVDVIIVLLLVVDICRMQVLISM